MKKLSVLISMIMVLSASAFAADSDKVERPQTVNAEGKVELSTGRYITSGVIGSSVGFGIGHGIQGRYAEKGWIFTAGEVVGLAMLLPSLATCAREKDDRPDNDCTSSEKTWIGAGWAVALGFRIWEVVDVWTGATPVDEKVSAFILPTPESTSIGMVYRF